MSEVARPEQRTFPFTVGRYTVYEPFASGGMATVHPGLFSGPAGFSRQVAVKRCVHSSRTIRNSYRCSSTRQGSRRAFTIPT